jgi:flagellar motility protein MotE (MotC chaperone)
LRLSLNSEEVNFVFGKKIIAAAGLILTICGPGFAVTSVVTASAQIETRQDPAQKEMQDRMAREANKKRQQDIREQTEKLFQLATELKTAVDKSNENLLSLDVIRKAEEVEKLAKKVKEKMKESVGPPAKQELPTPVPVYPH